MKALTRIASSFFFLGYLPAGGTWGSAAGLLVAFLAQGPDLPLITAVLTVVGFLFCHPAQGVFGKEDPPQFVLDEVCGMLVSLAWLPLGWPVFVASFLLFRLLDIVKLWPISWLERHTGPSGIMLDDLAAGVLTNLAIRLVLV